MAIYKIKSEGILIKLLFSLLILLNMNFLGFLSSESLSGLANSVNRTGEVALLIGIVMICLVKTQQIRLTYWTKYAFFVMVSILICGFYSIIVYSQTMFDIYVMVNCMLLLFVIPLLCNHRDLFYQLLKIVVIFAMLNVAVTCLQSLLYNVSGIVFVQNIESVTIRNGLIRYSNSAGYTPFLLIFLLGNHRMAREYPKFIRIVSVFLCLYAIVFVNQTRGVILPVFASIFVMMLFRYRDSRKKFFTVIGLGVAIIILASIPQFQFIFQSIFSESSQYASETHTVGIRIENILYRLSFFGKNPIFSMGVIRPLTSELISVSRGASGLYFYEDVGIFDTIASFGVFGVAMILLIWKRWWQSIVTLYRQNRLRERIWVLGMIVYYLLSGFSINYFEASRVLVFSIVVAAIEIEANEKTRTSHKNREVEDSCI